MTIDIDDPVYVVSTDGSLLAIRNIANRPNSRAPNSQSSQFLVKDPPIFYSAKIPYKYFPSL